MDVSWYSGQDCAPVNSKQLVDGKTSCVATKWLLLGKVGSVVNGKKVS